MEDQKFSITDVCELLNLPVDYHKRSVTVKCPRCGKKQEKKLNINFEKDAFRCAKCGISGYAIHLWALYRDIDFKDLTAAAKDYYNVSGKKNVEISSIKRIEQHKSIDVPTADIEIRNKTFNELLNVLNLSEDHYNALLKRGLNDDSIRNNQYKSYPVTGFSTIASILMQKGCILKGCPGFYTESDGKWVLRRLSSGFLIPQKDGFGRIQGFQIRLDSNSGSRYITLSTGDNYQNGAKGYANPHFSKGKRDLTELIITEGPLKGDIISQFTGFSVLSLQGVNSISKLDSILPSFAEQGTKTILTAFDMDIMKNALVQEALVKLQTKISDAGLSFQQLYWDEKYKGLDDWLYANRKSIKR